MIRNLKALLLAATVVTAFSAMAASAAQAAPVFTNLEGGNTTLTGEPDELAGTTTAHHVIDVPGNGSLTCNQVTFDQTISGNPVASFTVIPTWDVCKFLGQNVVINMHGCEFTFFPSGEVVIQNSAGKNCATNPITFSIPTCTVTVGPQTLTGATYHPKGTTATLSLLLKNIQGIAGASCPFPGAFTTGEYTTGNAIVKGENPATGVEKPVQVDP